MGQYKKKWTPRMPYYVKKRKPIFLHKLKRVKNFLHKELNTTKKKIFNSANAYFHKIFFTNRWLPYFHKIFRKILYNLGNKKINLIFEDYFRFKKKMIKKDII